MKTLRNKSKLMPGPHDVPSYATVSWNCRTIACRSPRIRSSEIGLNRSRRLLFNPRLDPNAFHSTNGQPCIVMQMPGHDCSASGLLFGSLAMFLTDIKNKVSPSFNLCSFKA